MKNELELIINWLRVNKLCLNADKTKFMVFDNVTDLDKFEITLKNSTKQMIREEKVRTKKYLGLVLDHQLKFYHRIDYIKKKIAKRIGAMYKSKNLLPLSK